MSGGLCPMVVRRRPTLPQPLGCSTIGAERLNFRVRYGTGCFPFRYGRRNSFNLTQSAPHPPGVSRGVGVVVVCLSVGNCLVDANQLLVWSVVVFVCARVAVRSYNLWLWCCVRCWDKPSAY